MKHIIIGACLLLPSAGGVLAENPHPFTIIGMGQPGSNNGISCGSIINGVTLTTPGGSVSAKGSPFNPSGQAGKVYAGNLGTASATHAQSGNAVSQYDVGCFQQQMP
jgi:hypothetical protein